MEDAYCSDPELDQNELEVALYSQVHFDPGPGSESWIRDASVSNSHRPFFVEVKSLTAKISATKSSQPVVSGDFLAFSENPIDNIHDNFKNNNQINNNQKKIINKSKPLKTLDQKEPKISHDVNFIIDKKGGNKSLIDNSSEVSVSKNNSDKIAQSSSIEKKSKKKNTLLKGDTSSSNFQNSELHKTESAEDIQEDKNDCTDASVSNEPARKNKTKDSVQTSKAVLEKILPFAVTKTKLAASDENLQLPESCKVSLNVNQPKENVAKLEDFLHLSKSETGTSSSKVKKKVNKLDEAVRIRKPPVYVRRPPVVVVKYKQDSDTNTDYSDSDCSSHASFMVAAKKKLPVDKVSRIKNANSDSLRCTEDNLAIQISPLVEENVSVKESDECIVLTDDVSDDDDLVEISAEIKPPHYAVESSASNEGSEISSEEEASVEIIPNLEFNLEGGMDALLTTPKNTDDGEWKIDEQDRFKINCIMSRYFSPLTVQCRNCRKEGHLSRDCPEPLKKKCAYCAQEGHVYQICPNTVCFNCDTPGHRNTNCPEPKRRWRIPCERCNVNGHSAEVCPDKWRQYHLSIDKNKLITQSRSAINTRVYCYNCASEGHFGHDCRKPRMNPHVPASYPLVAHYDNNGKKMHHRKKSRKGKDSIHNLKRKHSHVEVDDDGVKKRKSSQGKKREHHKGITKEITKGSLFPTTFKSQPNCQSSHLSLNIYPSSKHYYSNGDHSRSYDQDFHEDFEAHQVNNNEWWNAPEEQPARKKRCKKNEVHRANSFYEDKHWNNQDFRADPGRRQQNWDRGNWDQYGSRHNINNTNMRDNSGRYLEMDNAYLNENRGNFSQEPQIGRMKHSQSWPNVMKSRKNYGGFQFQNAQFEVMKRNCDRDHYRMGNM